MADNEVITELTVDASGTTDGTDQFAVSMQKVELILEQMLSVLTGTQIGFKNLGDQVELTSSTMDGRSSVLSSFTTSMANASAATAGFNTASASAAGGSNLLADSFTELQRGAAAATAGLGTINALVGALAAGGAIAIVAAGFKALSDAANSQGDAAEKVKALADGYGLTVDQAQALITAGAQLDQTQDAVTSGLARFSEQLDGVRQGSGNLYNELMKINPALTLQMQTTSSMQQELNLLAKAYAETGGAADKLAKTALGNSALGGVLTSISDASGMSGLVNNMQQYETATSAEVAQWADLKDQIDQTKAHAEGVLDSIFTTELLQGELSTAQFFDRFASAAKDFAISGDLSKLIDFFTNEAGGPDSAVSQFFKQVNNGEVPIPALVPYVGNDVFPSAPPTAVDKASGDVEISGPIVSAVMALGDYLGGKLQDVVDKLSGNAFAGYGEPLPGLSGPFQTAAGAQAQTINPRAEDLAPQVSTTPLTQADLSAWSTQQAANLKIMQDAVDGLNASESKIPLSAAAAYNAFKEQESALGGAATAAEQMTEENLRLAATPGLSADTIARASEYRDLQIAIASATQLTSAGVGDFNDILELQAEKLQLLKDSHPDMTYDQIAQATDVAAREAEKLWGNLEVLQSSTPQFTALLVSLQNAQQMTDTLKTADLQALISGTRSFASSIKRGLSVKKNREKSPNAKERCHDIVHLLETARHSLLGDRRRDLHAGGHSHRN